MSDPSHRIAARSSALRSSRMLPGPFRQFGATLDLFPNPTPPASDMSSLFRFLPGVDTSEYHHYFHTDLETPQTVPWTGLEASTRAYAKIIDEVNKLPLSTFQRPEDPTPTRQQVRRRRIADLKTQVDATLGASELAGILKVSPVSSFFAATSSISNLCRS